MRDRKTPAASSRLFSCVFFARPLQRCESIGRCCHQNSSTHEQSGIVPSVIALVYSSVQSFSCSFFHSQSLFTGTRLPYGAVRSHVALPAAVVSCGAAAWG